VLRNSIEAGSILKHKRISQEKMGLFENLRSFFIYTGLIFAPGYEDEILQEPLLPKIGWPSRPFTQSQQTQLRLKFPAPQGPEENGPFTCEYPDLDPSQWQACSVSTDPGCWLKGPNGQTYDVNSDYEKVWPNGILREVFTMSL
jgi:hypothetical protein